MDQRGPAFYLIEMKKYIFSFLSNGCRGGFYFESWLLGTLSWAGYSHNNCTCMCSLSVQSVGLRKDSSHSSITTSHLICLVVCHILDNCLRRFIGKF